jgi:hypothetical protein
LHDNQAIHRKRREEILANIRAFGRLVPSEKIRYVEKARRCLKYFKTLKFVKDSTV